MPFNRRRADQGCDEQTEQAEQRYHLLSDLTAVGNVEVPSIYAGREPAARRERALALLGRLGLAERTRHLPGQLSGGRQQRVSIARALMNGGAIILHR